MRYEVKTEDIRKHLQRKWDFVTRLEKNGASDALIQNAVNEYMACESMALHLFGVSCCEKDGIVYVKG